MFGQLYSAFSELSNLANNPPVPVAKSEVGELKVSTMQVFDTEYPFETAIKRDGDWIVVEEYDSEEEARQGHESWCSRVSDNPQLELVDVSTSNIKKIAES